MANDLVIHLNQILPSSTKLDYSEESIRIIDVLIEQLRKEGNDEKAAENEIMAFGAYVGEIIKLNYGGQWTTPELAGFPKDGVTFSVVYQLPNGEGINPLGRVLKYFRHGSQYSVDVFYDLVKKQIRKF
ncbi:hypothetical protein [Aequorivita sp. KMM 9714]|uniref:hypothetical protein n=1 Tax=Aequorivita sp. KMM 9714 TaxID=2707173 RepID=UPI0013EA59F0|nr:hypothetical protein [Aequorivita sp. KMM 9714]NGX85056.1 hypothetical protein [Aequorivita sp. KMM 9714]